MAYDQWLNNHQSSIINHQSLLKIKLTRLGKKHQPSYRIVVAEARSKRNGKYVELLGFYNPLTKPKTIKIDKKKYQEWLSKGAQPTETVRRLANDH